MTPEHFTIFKNALVEAVDTYLASGNKLVSGSFFSEERKCRCPIGCIAYETMLANENKVSGYAGAIALKLGIIFDDSDLWSFTDGFDNLKDFTIKNQEMFNFGAEMRAKYLPAEL